LIYRGISAIGFTSQSYDRDPFFLPPLLFAPAISEIPEPFGREHAGICGKFLENSEEYPTFSVTPSEPPTRSLCAALGLTFHTATTSCVVPKISAVFLHFFFPPGQLFQTESYGIMSVTDYFVRILHEH
jgi:hypothetical protein